MPLKDKQRGCSDLRELTRCRISGFRRRLFLVAIVSASCGTPCLLAQQALTLKDAIDSALASPAAIVFEEQVHESRAQVRQAHLGPNPRIFLQSEDLRPWDSNFSYSTKTEDYAYIVQTFELNHKRANWVGVAEANLRTAEAERDLNRQQLIARVASSYWSAASSHSIVALLKKDLVDVDEIVRFHKERVDAGAMRGIDLIRVLIERDRLYLALQTADRDAVLARAELFRQIGRQDFSNIQLTDEVATTRPLPAVNVEAALSQRLDLKIAQDQLASAQANLRLQKAIATPDLDLAAGYKRNSADNTLYTSMNMQLPFRNRNQGEIERAQAQVRLAEHQLQQATIVARADIEEASNIYNRQLEIVQHTLPEMRDRAHQNLSIITEAYRIGGVDLLRYIDAERTEIDVESTALRNLTDFQKSAVGLLIAIGERP